MNEFKKQAIKEAAQYVMNELNCTLIEAITKMQGTAAKKNQEEVLESLIEFKRELIAAM
jgi:hypothetical protein